MLLFSWNLEVLGRSPEKMACRAEADLFRQMRESGDAGELLREAGPIGEAVRAALALFPEGSGQILRLKANGVVCPGATRVRIRVVPTRCWQFADDDRDTFEPAE
jgi:hypothetical protein